MLNEEPEESAAEQDELERLAAVPRRKLIAQLAKQRKLIANLRGDLDRHGDADRWKRYGDLLFANTDAQRRDDKLLVRDFFDDAVPEIEIDAEIGKSVTEVAEDYFRRYTKARNAARIVTGRIAATESAMAESEAQLGRITAAISAGDEGFLLSLTKPVVKASPVSKKRKAETAFKGARRFMSSDGFEILVGKKAADNDFLTFRLSKSLDTWLHAADYPGSHVIIRNQNKKEIPTKTLLEAAELAAFYSDARKMPKAAVNHTLRKFVNKPKRSAPGLVSLAKFKTVLVVPKVTLTMI
ncbi:MAG: NFACT RNA binding domain-containing protein [Pyrinomonadaceae bacterium]